MTLIDETTQRHPLAVINVDCPFFQGQTEALCMDDTLHDLVIRNIDGSRLLICPFFQLVLLPEPKISKMIRPIENLKSMIRF